RYHPQVEVFRRQHPYTWSGDTLSEASRWANELRADAMSQRKHLVIDTTTPRASLIRELQSQGYEVEVRALASHRLESELGVDARFSDGVDSKGHGRYVPESVRNDVYQKLPGHLDDIQTKTGVPVQIYDRDGDLH